MKAESNIHQLVTDRIEEIPEGIIFDYNSFEVLPSGELSLAKALSRLALQGSIVRLSKGKYYKPKESLFGMLKPAEDEIVKSLTYKGDKVVGYLTGGALYNRMALTTQVPNVLIVATNTVLPPKKVGQYRVKYSKRTVEITEETIPLLRVLDALMDIKLISDAEVNQSLTVLIAMIKKLSRSQQQQMIALAGSYNAASRALLGAIAEAYLPGLDVRTLKESLNVFSKYKIGASKKILPNAANWYIV